MGVKTKEKSPKGKAKTGIFAKIGKLFKLICLLIDIVPLMIFAALYIYNIVSGNFIVLHTILLCATIAYATFCIILYYKNSKKLTSSKKISKKAYAIVKTILDIAVNTANIATIVYTQRAAMEQNGGEGMGEYTIPVTIATIFFSINLIRYISKLLKLIIKLIKKSKSLAKSIRKLKRKQKNAAALTETKEKVVATTKEAAEKVKNATENTKSAIGAGMTKTKNAVVNTAKKAGNSIANTTKKAGNAIANTAKNAAEKAKNIAGGAKNAIGTAAGKVKSVFKNKNKPAIEAPEAEIAQLPEAGGGEE